MSLHSNLTTQSLIFGGVSIIIFSSSTLMIRWWWQIFWRKVPFCRRFPIPFVQCDWEYGRICDSSRDGDYLIWFSGNNRIPIISIFMVPDVRFPVPVSSVVTIATTATGITTSYNWPGIVIILVAVATWHIYRHGANPQKHRDCWISHSIIISIALSLLMNLRVRIVFWRFFLSQTFARFVVRKAFNGNGELAISENLKKYIFGKQNQ